MNTSGLTYYVVLQAAWRLQYNVRKFRDLFYVLYIKLSTPTI